MGKNHAMGYLAILPAIFVYFFFFRTCKALIGVLCAVKMKLLAHSLDYQVNRWIH